MAKIGHGSCVCPTVRSLAASVSLATRHVKTTLMCDMKSIIKGLGVVALATAAISDAGEGSDGCASHN